MFPDELDEALDTVPIVYLTYGLCELHGLYSALGVDAFIPHGIACVAAERYGGVVAPPFFWHVHEMGLEAPWAHTTIGDRNPWLTSLPPWVMFKCVWFQFRAVASRGFHAAIVISGHSPYQRDLQRLAEVFMRHSALRVWAGGTHDAYGDIVQGDDDHAGACETSLLWAVQPSLVDLSRLPVVEPADNVAGGRGAARWASRREGERLVSHAADWLGRKAAELLADYQPPTSGGWRAPGDVLGAMTFDEAEAAWRSEVEPQLREFSSFKKGDDYGHVPPGSPWAANERSAFYP
jgi:creatinine amidohydrolase/Fe(II)-dependent formamide hydrolase-like protein